MNTIQFDLGGGASIDLPVDIVAQRLIERLRQPIETPQQPHRYKIGEHVPGQGGIYAGDIRGDDGTTYGLIVAEPKDVGTARWISHDGRGLSEWDGLYNTNWLRARCPAARLAGGYEADGHEDFYLPARREMMIASANVPHLFGKVGRYWTSTPRGENRAWAVGFESGCVSVYFRHFKFRVRPFRSFPVNSIHTNSKGTGTHRYTGKDTYTKGKPVLIEASVARELSHSIEEHTRNFLRELSSAIEERARNGHTFIRHNIWTDPAICQVMLKSHLREAGYEGPIEEGTSRILTVKW